MVPALGLLPADAATLPARPTALTGTAAAATGGSAGNPLLDLAPALGDVDRLGTALPTAAQRAAATALGDVELRWNQLGTPASILPRRGDLGAAPGTPAEGARAWLRQNAAVLGLSTSQVDGLELVSDQTMAGSTGHAVLLRQRFDGLSAATGGMVTVGVAGGRVHYVSSSLSRARDGLALPEPTLGAVQGWLRAATDAGLPVAGLDSARITSVVSDGWTRLTVPGIAQEQQVRLRAVGLADGTARPVLEANVVDVAGGGATAFTTLVDAVTGDVLVRRSRVDHAAYNDVFTGSLSGTSCGPRHAFELKDSATRTLTAVATALPVDDVTVTFSGPSGVLATSDLLTAPEVATYTAPKPLPAGTYAVQVCPFDASSITVGAYALTVSTSDAAAPSTGGSVLPAPLWRFFPGNPSLAAPGELEDTSRTGCWQLPDDRCDLPTGELRNVAATGAWDTLANGVPTFTTVGNNASTHEAWASPLTPGGLLQAPYSPTREYDTEFTDAWHASGCDPTQLAPGGNDIDASVTNLFAAHNRMHDYSYYLGFTEENYNLQADNLGRGGRGGDPEVGNAQAGAVTGGSTGQYLGRDNANQIALQDGVPGITNQYLFQPIAGAFYAPCRDGGLDMGIVGHEYTHAISNRMVGGPDDGLTSEHGGAMGESWSDLVAGEYMFSHGYGNGGNPWAIGVYATGNEKVAIRDYAIDANPLNFSDYGFDSTGAEVHADGEIWNGVNWEVRQALVDKYDAKFPYADKALQLRCAQATRNASPLAADQCPGNRRWVQLVFDSFLLQQGATSMVDARDAFVAADRMRFGGADVATIDAAFARRGLGAGASTPSPDSEDVTASFASASGGNAPVTFRSSRPGQVFVGDYEARVTPVADTDSATALGATASFTPGTYKLVFVSPTGGATRFTMKVASGGRATTVTVPDFGPNLAAETNGASVISATAGSRNAEALIDGAEATNWGGVTAENVDVSQPSVTVDLAGNSSLVSRIQVSAMLNPAPASGSDLPLAAAAEDDPDSGSRFTALRRFAIEVCNLDCTSKKATWTRVLTSSADAFPAMAPRPVAPDLTLRSFTLPSPVQAQAVRLVALENQCTGYAGYAGEQDSDPLNDTDCASASDRGTIVHAAELQVFGR
ncbi:M36 family metallopeptidase [Nocardioides flavescens]|nr:M36 family metallopeptidase [Nocardioides flavescens]